MILPASKGRSCWGSLKLVELWTLEFLINIPVSTIHFHQLLQSTLTSPLQKKERSWRSATQCSIQMDPWPNSKASKWNDVASSESSNNSKLKSSVNSWKATLWRKSTTVLPKKPTTGWTFCTPKDTRCRMKRSSSWLPKIDPCPRNWKTMDLKSLLPSRLHDDWQSFWATKWFGTKVWQRLSSCPKSRKELQSRRGPFQVAYLDLSINPLFSCHIPVEWKAPSPLPP